MDSNLQDSQPAPNPSNPLDTSSVVPPENNNNVNTEAAPTTSNSQSISAGACALVTFASLPFHSRPL